MGAGLSTRYSIAIATIVIAGALGLLTLSLGRWLGPRPWPPAENPPSEYGGQTRRGLPVTPYYVTTTAFSSCGLLYSACGLRGWNVLLITRVPLTAGV